MMLLVVSQIISYRALSEHRLHIINAEEDDVFDNGKRCGDDVLHEDDVVAIIK